MFANEVLTSDRDQHLHTSQGSVKVGGTIQEQNSILNKQQR